MNSQPVVLTMIPAPVVLPLPAWAALRLKRALADPAARAPSLIPYFTLLRSWFGIS